MSYCDECIHLQYEQDTNACYCDLDLNEPNIDDNPDLECMEFDTGEQIKDDD